MCAAYPFANDRDMLIHQSSKCRIRKSFCFNGILNFTSDTLFDIEEKLDISLINAATDEPKEIIHKYNLEVSVRADDILSNEFVSSSILNEKTAQYISYCGGMAVTSV